MPVRSVLGNGEFRQPIKTIHVKSKSGTCPESTRELSRELVVIGNTNSEGYSVAKNALHTRGYTLRAINFFTESER